MPTTGITIYITGLNSFFHNNAFAIYTKAANTHLTRI